MALPTWTAAWMAALRWSSTVAFAANLTCCTSTLREDFAGDDSTADDDSDDDDTPGDDTPDDDDDDTPSGDGGGGGPVFPFMLVSSVPEMGATGVSVVADIELVSQELFEPGPGSILIRRAKDDSLFAAIPAQGEQVSLQDTTLKIAPHAAFGGETEYYLEFEEGALLSNGSPVSAFGGPEFLSFTTESAPAPGGVAAGLVGWFDAAHQGTVILAADQVVAWGDRSGRGRSVAAPSEEARPGYLPSALNAQPVVDFNGAAALRGKPPVLPGADDTVTLFAVWQTRAAAGQVVFDQDAAQSAVGTRAAIVTKSGGNYGFSGGSNDFDDAHAYVPESPQVTVVRLTGSNEINVIHNGAIETGSISIATLNVAQDGMALGQSYAGKDQNLDGFLAELVFYDRVMTFQEEQDVQAYLAEKWGIELVGPQLLETEPEVKELLVDQATDIVLTFDREVSAGSGEIRVLLRDNHKPVARFAADDEAVTYSGSTVRVDPDGLLTGGTEFYVTVDAGAIVDAEMQPFIGFKDANALWFTVDDVVPAGLRAETLVWLDAAYPASFERDMDGKLVRWLDRSGKNNHAVQMAAANRPRVVSNAVGANAVVRFGDGADTWLTTDLVFDPSEGFEVHAVVRFEESSTGQDTVVHLLQGTGTARPIYYREPATTNFCTFSGPEILCRAGAIRFEYQLLSIDYDGTTANLYVDGDRDATAEVDISANEGRWVIGAANNANFLRGDIAELFIMNRELSDGEIPVLEKDVANSWGVPYNERDIMQ